VATGARRGELSAPDGSVGGLGFSADGEMLAFADDTGTVHFGSWRRPGFAAPPPPQNEFQAVAFSPDGRLLGSVAESEVAVWDVLSGRRRAGIALPGETFRSVGFNAPGKWLGAGSDDRIRLYRFR
jgi:WD40 repeat protein